MSDTKQTTENNIVTGSLENEEKIHVGRNTKGEERKLKEKGALDKGKVPVEKTVVAEHNEDDDEEDDEFYAEDDSDDDENEDENEEQEDDADAEEDEDLPGPSSGIKRKAKDIFSTNDDDDEAGRFEILEGLSGDEVDPALIISGGRRARRSGASTSRPKYTAAAQLDSDEDEW